MIMSAFGSTQHIFIVYENMSANALVMLHCVHKERPKVMNGFV